MAAAPLLAAAAEPVTLPPASPWVLDYADNSCRLTRSFGNAADPTVLLFESASPGSMSMVAIGDQLKVFSGEKVTARFLPDQRFVEGQGATSSDGKKPAALWSHMDVIPSDLAMTLAARTKDMPRPRSNKRPPPIDLAGVAVDRRMIDAFRATVTEVEIDAPRARPTRLQTGPLARAMTMLDQCTREQLREWGVDPEVEDKIVQRAWPIRISSWFNPADYPSAALALGEQSVVKFRLLVDAIGRPTHCTTLSHVNAPAFQQIVCKVLMSRARFEPAELADGTKVPSYYSTDVIWRLE